MPSLNTEFHGHAVKFSPFNHTRLAIAALGPLAVSSQEPQSHGRLLILNATTASVTNVISFNTFNGLNECAWSELNNNIIVAGDDHGSVMIFNLNSPPSSNPIASGFGHYYFPISSIDWNAFRPDYFLTSGGDFKVKIWTIGEENLETVHTYDDHDQIYSSIWNPSHGDIFACAGRGILRIYDIREQGFATEVGFGQTFCSCDWCKYNDTCIATASGDDNCIKTWDIRCTHLPSMVLACEPATDIYAGPSTLKKVKFSPDPEKSQIASCSENMEVALWNYLVEGPPTERFVHHTRPVRGLDMSTLVNGLMASTGLDGLVRIWNRLEVEPRPGIRRPFLGCCIF